MLELVLMPRRTGLPGQALMDLVCPEARVRAAPFLSEKRRSEFLWSRVLLGRLLADYPQAVVMEQPPRSPALTGVPFTQTCISHTHTWVGVVVSDKTVGIDLEVMNPTRVSESLFTRLFPKRHWDASGNTVLDFYRFFGMYEAAVKMNVPFVCDSDVPYVGKSAEAPCRVRFFGDGETLLTLVSAEDEPVTLRCFDADPQALTLTERRQSPFAPLPAAC